MFLVTCAVAECTRRLSAGLEPEKKPPRVSLSEEELGQRLLQVAATAAQEAEARLNQQHQREMQAERARIGEAIVQFQGERTEYYSRVEPELVNLVLAVAGGFCTGKLRLTACCWRRWPKSR